MKLDFSALAQPAESARGQVGTAGTPATSRVSASPLAQPGAGTPGDKLAPLAALPESAVVAAAPRPQPSPACPQVAGVKKINADTVSPVSPLVPVESAQVAETPFAHAGPDGKARADANAKTCADCLHLLRHGTCGEPVVAGLMPSFGIVWPPDGHATGCAAFSARAAS